MSAPSFSEPDSKWSELIWGPYALTSFILIGWIAVHAVNITIIATMLPSIVQDIGGQDFYAWTATFATISAILSAALTGHIFHKIGAKPSFYLAGAIFITGCILSALTPTIGWLLLGRALQGIGGGMIFTLCYSMIMFSYPERLWPRAMALLSGIWGIMMLFGPAIGGIFAEWGLWRWGFSMMIPIIGLLIILTMFLLPIIDKNKHPISAIPYTQLTLLAFAILSISVGAIATSLLWAGGSILLSIILLIGLVFHENRSAIRLFPRGALQRGTALSHCFAIMALLIFSINTEFFMPYYLQVLHNIPPIWAGYMAASVSIGWSLSEVLSARLEDHKMHMAIMTGPISIFIACLCLILVLPLTDASTLIRYSLLLMALIGLGIGIGIGWPHLNSFALKLTPAQDQQMAASALSTIQMSAVAFGSATAGLIGNFSGFQDIGNLDNISESAQWIFSLYALAACLALYHSYRLITCLQYSQSSLSSIQK